MSESMAEHIDAIELAASSMQRLVNDVLDLTKLQEGRLEIHREPVRLHSQLLPLRLLCTDAL